MVVESRISLFNGKFNFPARILEDKHEEVIQAPQGNTDPEIASLLRATRVEGTPAWGIAIRVRVVDGVDILDVDRYDPNSGPLVSDHPARSYSGLQINEAQVVSGEVGIPFGGFIGRLIGYKKTFSQR